MSKVILTQEQADAVDWLERTGTLEGNVRIIFFTHELERGPKSKILKDMGFYRVMRAIFQGYKTKEHFEVGDWAKDSKGRLFKITEDRVHTANNDPRYQELEKATDEEVKKYWWNKHGRDVWELKEGDVLIINDHSYQIVAQVIEKEGETLYWFDSPDGPGNVTQQHLIDEDEWEWQVIYFAEDRKDI